MNGNIDTSKDLVIYQDNFDFVLSAVLVLMITLILFVVGKNLYQNENLDLAVFLMVSLLFLIFLFVFLKICKDFFSKTPLLRVNNKGFFTKKTGNILWVDVDSISILSGGGPSIAFLMVNLKNGKKITINTNSVRIPSNQVFSVNQAQQLLDVLSAYKEAVNS